MALQILIFLGFLLSQIFLAVAFRFCYLSLQQLLREIPKILAEVRKQGNQEVFAAFLEGVAQARRLEIERLSELASDPALVEKLKKPVRKHV